MRNKNIDKNGVYIKGKMSRCIVVEKETKWWFIEYGKKIQFEDARQNKSRQEIENY